MQYTAYIETEADDQLSKEFKKHYKKIRFFSPKILSLLISFIFLFSLLQVVQNSGLGPVDSSFDDQQGNLADSPAGIGDESVFTLEVNVIMKEEVEQAYPVTEQLVEIFWNMRDVQTNQMGEYTVSSNTDENGIAVFDLFAGEYTLRVNYQGISKNETISILANTENKIDWMISKYSIPSYNLEFKDKNGGIIYPKETITIIYENSPLLLEPVAIQLVSERAEITGFEVINVRNIEKVAIIDLNPIENFKVGEFSAENPLKASIYSIDVNKKSGN